MQSSTIVYGSPEIKAEVEAIQAAMSALRAKYATQDAYYAEMDRLHGLLRKYSHRWCRKEHKDVLSAGAFVYVSNMVLAARKVLHSKNAMPEVAAELAKPITNVVSAFHVPTRGWEIGNGIKPVTEFN